MKDMYGRICKRNPKVKMIGIIAIMRKMLLLTYTLWKNGDVYDEKKTGTYTPDKRRIDGEEPPTVQEWQKQKVAVVKDLQPYEIVWALKGDSDFPSMLAKVTRFF